MTLGWLYVQVAVEGSLSLAWRLGQAVAAARHAKRCVAEAVASEGGGRVLFRGKTADVQRQTTEGFARGSVALEALESGQGAERIRIDFQNENLVAWEEAGETAVPVATVPDLICVIELERELAASGRQRHGYGINEHMSTRVRALPVCCYFFQGVPQWPPRSCDTACGLPSSACQPTPFSGPRLLWRW